jgi:hypothetical protein
LEVRPTFDRLRASRPAFLLAVGQKFDDSSLEPMLRDARGLTVFVRAYVAEGSIEANRAP